MYFWFPLLAGLSELTFDPRQEIRYGALGVLFDILKFHGSSFTPQFWIRVYDSVLLPMFDHVRAEVTDTTTFTDEARRAEVDAWLYETCTATLQHMVDVVARYHSSVPALLTRTLDLLSGLIRRSHSSLAAVGVAALTRLALACGGGQEIDDEETWSQISAAFTSAAEDTNPAVREIIKHRMAVRSEGGTWSLGTGAGSRRLNEVKCRAGTQLLLAQACGEVYAAHSRSLPTAAAVSLLDVLQSIAQHATLVDADVGLRHSLLMAQAADGVPVERMLPDPPLLRLEVEAAQAYLSVLLTITACGPESLKIEGEVESRLVTLCMHNLERFEQQSLAASAAVEAAAGSHHDVGFAGQNHSSDGDKVVNGSVEQLQATSAAALAAENEALSPLAVATLKALLSFSPDVFKNRIKDLFPLLTSLISCETAPPEVQRVLSEVFASRIGSMMA
jgi:brefeldin A-inhibited guanine nucleotide-exchange protein